MFLSNLSRIDLLSLLPKGGEVAEIGVAEGDFSRHIFTIAAPSRLHLIDPWEHQSRIDYQNDSYGNPPTDEQEVRFQKVLNSFILETKNGRIVIHRTYSTDAAAGFDENQFDWIYLDGLHSREGVAADLAAFKNKVKPEGFILGHDYTNHSPAQQAGFGVVEAVNDFVSESEYHFLIMTMENFPTYVLTRTPESRPSQELVAKLMYHASWMVELRNFPEEGKKHQFQHKAIKVGDKVIAIPSF
jgi:hypothetical protein